MTRLRDRDSQWAAMLPYLVEAERFAARDDGPASAAPAPETRGRPRRVLRPRPHLVVRREISREGYILRFTGKEATSSLLHEVLEEIGAGGLSGKPVKERSTEVIRYLATKSNKSFPIIGVGGIHSAEDALEKLDAGADLIQVYTGFIYEGPRLLKRINKAIIARG